MDEIVQKENKILRKVAKPVAIADIRSRKVETIIRRMIKAVSKEEDGVAIAAPQIGENLRIFVISKKLFEILDEEKASKKSKREMIDELATGSHSASNFAEVALDKEAPRDKYKDMIFINPEILKISKEKMIIEEGCLSVRWLYGKVKRSKKTLVKAYDENGKVFTMGGSGLLSQAFQHEIDHLNGVLFTDKAKGLKEMNPDTK